MRLLSSAHPYHVIKNPFLLGCIEPFSYRLDYGIINLAANGEIPVRCSQIHILLI